MEGTLLSVAQAWRRRATATAVEKPHLDLPPQQNKSLQLQGEQQQTLLCTGEYSTVGKRAEEKPSTPGGGPETSLIPGSYTNTNMSLLPLSKGQETLSHTRLSKNIRQSLNAIERRGSPTCLDPTAQIQGQRTARLRLGYNNKRQATAGGRARVGR